MITLITGVLGMALVVTYLGYYAVTLKQLPLWIVIIGVLAMALWDLGHSTWRELRGERRGTEEAGRD